MLSADDNDRLTRVGPGTPMGALLRRYWHPIAAEGELAANPIRPVRLLGEDLVLYRDKAGTYGLVARRCPHRGADLAYGIVDRGGLRCSYHGWCFDERGRCTEQPFEEAVHPDGRFREQAEITAYPVAPKAGLVWVYLGPAPAPCLMDWARFHDPGRPAITITRIPCNWLQCQENSIDPVHFEWLHQNLRSDRIGSGGRAPRHRKIAFDEFEFGFIYRRVLENTDETHPLWTVGRVSLWPECLYAGAFVWHVPIDDENTLDVSWSLAGDGPFRSGKELHRRGELQFSAGGLYSLHDPTHQDAVAMLGQGTIADRTHELLGESDRGVILLRRRLLAEIEAVAEGRDPKGVLRDEARNHRIPLPLYRGPALGGSRATRLRRRARALLGQLGDRARSRWSAPIEVARRAVRALRAKGLIALRKDGPDMHAMLHGHRLSALLYVVAKLRVADALAAGPQNEDEVARAVGAHGASLGRILRALAAQGVFAEHEGRFSLTDAGRRLCADARDSLRGTAILVGEEYMPAWHGLLHSARTGETAFAHVFGMSSWEHRRQHPELNEAFNAFGARGAESSGRLAAEAWDFAGIERITDVGGGSGTFLALILGRHPHLKGTLFDLPHVVADAPAVLARMGVAERCQIAAGDFFVAVPPGADLYLLKNVLHDWSDERAIAILKACRAACSDAARLLVLEMLLPAQPGPGSSTWLIDVHMLAVTGGRERSEAGYRQLFSASGFTFLRSHRIGRDFYALEARTS